MSDAVIYRGAPTIDIIYFNPSMDYMSGKA